MKLPRIIRKFLNKRLGLYTASQVESREKEFTRLRTAVEPLVQFAIETAQKETDVAFVWSSRHYGCESVIYVRDISNIGRAAWPDFEFRRLRIPETSLAYRDWQKRREEDEGA